MPTIEQKNKIEELQKSGYTWNKAKSAAACGVIMEKGHDFYFFGLYGEILHNPQGMIISIF